MEETECSICNEFISIKNTLIVCPNCEHVFCCRCQKTYAKDSCMNCHMKFKHKFLEEHMGKKFMEKIIKPKIIEELMMKEKDNLKYVQSLADWEKSVREQKKKLRFGVKMTISPRPNIDIYQKFNDIFPCPLENCRGFIKDGQCGICGASICLKCHEKKLEKHECKLDDIQSLAIIMANSKKCPKCLTNIQRSVGCDHMYCTNCHTPFNWVTGEVMKANSNEHYLNLQKFTRDVQLVDNVPVANACAGERDFSLYRDNIDIDTIGRGRLLEHVVKCLWDDCNTIRLVKRSLYDEGKIETETSFKLQDLQVKYLLGDISELQWSRMVYRITREKSLRLMYGDILNIYLSTVGFLQQQIGHQANIIRVGDSELLDKQGEIFEQYNKLVVLCNEGFKSIQEEYGGNLHHVREMTEDKNAPPFV